MAGRLEDVARDLVERAAGDARARRVAHPLERLAHERRQGARPSAVTSPTTNVRVMSAQHAALLVARPQVDRDRQVGRQRPGAGIVPAAGERRDDHDLRRRRARRARRRPRGSPRAPARRSAARRRGAGGRRRARRRGSSSLAPRPCPASAARWARRMPASSAGDLTRRRASTAAPSTVTRDALGAQPVGDRHRQVGGDDGVVDPHRGGGPDDESRASASSRGMPSSMSSNSRARRTSTSSALRQDLRDPLASRGR